MAAIMAHPPCRTRRPCTEPRSARDAGSARDLGASHAGGRPQLASVPSKRALKAIRVGSVAHRMGPVVGELSTKCIRMWQRPSLQKSLEARRQPLRIELARLETGHWICMDDLDDLVRPAEVRKVQRANGGRCDT